MSSYTFQAIREMGYKRLGLCQIQISLSLSITKRSATTLTITDPQGSLFLMNFHIIIES